MMIRTLVLTLSLLALAPAPASAWHDWATWTNDGRGDTNRRPGAGGIFYTGSPHDRGLTCAACHTGAPGRLRATVSFQPPLVSGRYVPNQTYTVRFQATNVCGTRFGVGLSILDGAGMRTSGRMQTTKMTTDGMFGLAFADVGNPNDFLWTAPGPGAGRTRLFAGIVTFQCGDGPPSEYEGDDVLMMEEVVDESTGAGLVHEAPADVRWAASPVAVPPRRRWV